MRDLGTRKNIKNTSDKSTLIETNTDYTQKPKGVFVTQQISDGVPIVTISMVRMVEAYCTIGGIIEIIDDNSGLVVVRKTLALGENLSEKLGGLWEINVNDGAITHSIQVPAADPGTFNVSYMQWGEA